MDAMIKVKYSDGRVEEMDFFDGFKVRDLVEDLQCEGRKGHFVRESTGRRQSINSPLIPGETYVFMEKRPKFEEPWMTRQAKMPSASILAKSYARIIKYLGGPDQVYDIGRISGCMPLPLAHEAFARYADLFRTLVPTQVDMANVWNLFEMSEFYEADKQRHRNLFDHLTSYLKTACPHLEFQFRTSVGSGKKNTEEVDILVDAKVGDSWEEVMKVELKNEVGFAGEPCIEAMKHYGEYVNETVHSVDTVDGKVEYKRWSFYHSCVPMLIVEVVGANIRVGGAICHDRPGYLPLTPYLHLLKFGQDLDHFNQVARAIAAIPRCLEELADYYRKIEPETGTSGRDGRDESVTWPWYVRKEREKDPHLQVVKFSRRLDRTTLRQMFQGRDEQLLYLLKYSRGESKIVKFSQRYGSEVHRKWHEAGLAPGFTLTELEGGWKVIRMDVYAPEDGWMPLNRLDPAQPDNLTNRTALEPASWDACKKAVYEAYRRVHNLHPDHVHGDLKKKQKKLAVASSHTLQVNSLQNRVMFIDFDWAGVQNQVRYPLFLNPLITWPEGVKSGGLMLSSHDDYLLRKELKYEDDHL